MTKVLVVSPGVLDEFTGMRTTLTSPHPSAQAPQSEAHIIKRFIGRFTRIKSGAPAILASVGIISLRIGRDQRRGSGVAADRVRVACREINNRAKAVASANRVIVGAAMDAISDKQIVGET